MSPDWCFGAFHSRRSEGSKGPLYLSGSTGVARARVPPTLDRFSESRAGQGSGTPPRGNPSPPAFSTGPILTLRPSCRVVCGRDEPHGSSVRRREPPSSTELPHLLSDAWVGFRDGAVAWAAPCDPNLDHAITLTAMRLAGLLFACSSPSAPLPLAGPDAPDRPLPNEPAGFPSRPPEADLVPAGQPAEPLPCAASSDSAEPESP